MFHWINAVQSYNKNGWNYIEKIKELSIDIMVGGTLDTTFVMDVDCIVKTGSVDCKDAEDTTEMLSEILMALANFNLPTSSPTATSMPSESPTNLPTASPVLSPTGSPTTSSAPTGSPVIFSNPSRPVVDDAIRAIKEKQVEIEAKILVPQNSDEQSIYSFDGFVESLKVMAEGAVEGYYFYVGHGRTNNRVYQKRGLVNIAAFLSHTRTLTIGRNTCDEINVDV